MYTKNDGKKYSLGGYGADYLQAGGKRTKHINQNIGRYSKVKSPLYYIFCNETAFNKLMDLIKSRNTDLYTSIREIYSEKRRALNDIGTDESRATDEFEIASARLTANIKKQENINKIRALIVRQYILRMKKKDIVDFLSSLRSDELRSFLKEVNFPFYNLYSYAFSESSSLDKDSVANVKAKAFYMGEGDDFNANYIGADYIGADYINADGQGSPTKRSSWLNNNGIFVSIGVIGGLIVGYMLAKK
ncbi:MAG: hypothetical protein NC918_06135 [Candidatus Omnitrophica bacterium]|nr:hypothetical protein [Candidatus Omnitrophota bacterium]